MTKTVNRRVQKAPPAKTSAIPAPFKAASETLAPLLNTFDKDNVYITHMDRHPAAFKMRIFIIPVLLNFGILMGLLWRLYMVLPWYYALLVTLLQGPQTPEKSFDRSVVFTILRRLVTMVIDYALLRVVWKWPITFFIEMPESPMTWRMKVWFRDNEVVARVSRGWGKSDLMGGAKQGTESPFFKTRILPALQLDKMQKTGYLLQDASWDLDFGVMVQATRLVDKKVLKESQLDRKIFVWSGDEKDGQWAVWDEKVFGQEITEEVEELEEKSNTEHREKILLIQDKLKDMDKEDLFFKWVELIQYESSQPGGFSHERQLEAGAKVQALFEEHGVDLEKFESDVGIMRQS